MEVRHGNILSSCYDTGEMLNFHELLYFVIGVTPDARKSNRRSLVREVERGKFMFQEKVPFTFLNGNYKCGICPEMMSSNLMNMLKHIRDQHHGEPL